MTGIDWYKIWWKIKTKWIKIVLYTLVWGGLSIMAGYPRFCFYGETDIFTVSTISQFCIDFLLPTFLFLSIFFLDITVVISKKWFNEKNINAFKGIFYALLLFFGSLIILIYLFSTSEGKLPLKLGIFLIMWVFIVSIKGITFYIQREWEEPIFVTKDTNNIS
jgi:hypothetical protein